MRKPCIDENDPMIQQAITDLKQRILARYADAWFTVGYGEDPVGIYLNATINVDDAFEMMPLVNDRLHEIQVEQGLPVYLIPLEPRERSRPSNGAAAATASRP